MDARALVNAAVDYLRRNPEEVPKALFNAAGLRAAIPIVAIRYLIGQLKPGKKAPKDVDISAAPPAIRVAATVDAMGTAVRATTSICIDEVRIEPDTLRVTLRLTDTKLALVGDSDSPVATLIKSGALDLSKPGNLAKYIPKRPPLIAEAGGDRIVLDLMKVPKIAGNARLRRALSIVSPVLGVRAIETDADHLYVALRANRRGVRRAIDAARQALREK